MTDNASLDRGMTRGLVVFRALTLGWAWVGLVLERSHLTRPALAIAALSAAGIWTFVVTGAGFSGRDDRTRLRLAIVEVALAGALLAGEPLVYTAERSQSLAWAWPAAGIIAMAITAGPVWATGSALSLSLASVAGESWLRSELQWTTASASKSALLILAAVAAARVAGLLREAGREISTARAREEVGRVLHDGVLQTLAVIQRRSDDPELRRLARDQEQELRTYLFEAPRSPEALPVHLRLAIAAVSRRYGVEIIAVLADDLPPGSPAMVDALAGAMTEALNNAAKHAQAGHISVYAEPIDEGSGVYCSIRDDGIGFEAGAQVAGRGIMDSIERRMAEIGGVATVTSRPGHGTEVQLWTIPTS